MDENKPSRYLTTLATTIGSIGNPTLSELKDGPARNQCAAKALELKRKSVRNISDEVRFRFYSLEANSDQSRRDELLLDFAASLNGCLLRFRKQNTDHLLTLFGLLPGSLEAEAVKAKEFASVLLQETQRMQADLEAKYAAADKLLAEARHEIATLQTQLAEVQNARASETADLRADLEKVRTELQTALTPKVVEAFDDMVQDAVKAKALTEAHALIEQQQKLIIKYRSAVSAKFDDEYVAMLELFLRIFDDPNKKLEAKALGYTLLNSVLSKE